LFEYFDVPDKYANYKNPLLSGIPFVILSAKDASSCLNKNFRCAEVLIKHNGATSGKYGKYCISELGLISKGRRMAGKEWVYRLKKGINRAIKIVISSDSKYIFNLKSRSVYHDSIYAIAKSFGVNLEEDVAELELSGGEKDRSFESRVANIIHEYAEFFRVVHLEIPYVVYLKLIELRSFGFDYFAEYKIEGKESERIIRMLCKNRIIEPTHKESKQYIATKKAKHMLLHEPQFDALIHKVINHICEKRFVGSKRIRKKDTSAQIIIVKNGVHDFIRPIDEAQEYLLHV
jgi:hypothetical protein